MTLSPIPMDRERLLELNSILLQLKTQYGLSSSQVMELMQRDESAVIPLSIYRQRDIGIMELTVQYMKDRLGYSYTEIARLLNRDARTVWVMYSNAARKSAELAKSASKETVLAAAAAEADRQRQVYRPSPEYSIPISVFSDRNLGALQAIVLYLKDTHKLKFAEIGRLMNRDARIICTVFHKKFVK
jgi:hypothetical protein